MPGYSLNAAGAAFPELGILFLTSASSKPVPSLQQLNLNPAIRESLRKRDQKLIDPDESNQDSEAARAAERAQLQAKVGTDE